MSVDLENEILEAQLDPYQFVQQPPFIGAVRFTASVLRQLDFSVGYDPVPGNEYHGEVWGQFSGSKKKQLLAIAQPYVLPEGA
jgi:hypothetical protein